jgi:hypothetical protein
MGGFEPTREDMAAAKAEGDLVGMLLAAGGRERKRPKNTDETPIAEAPVDFGPLHRPGAWPFGVGNPGPNTCHPDCGCAIKPRTPEEK